MAARRRHSHRGRERPPARLHGSLRRRKRETATHGIADLAADPYAAALVAQHRVHVYRRYRERPDWTGFFSEVESARDKHLLAAGAPLRQLLRDYALVRAGDLASLAFCNNWKDTADDGCGYAMRLDETLLLIRPDPFNGRTIDIEIEARELDNRPFSSAADARSVAGGAKVVAVRGKVSGARS